MTLLPFGLVLAALPAFAVIERPVPPGGGATPVQVFCFVLDVDKVDSAEQSFDANVFVRASWSDPRLAHPGPGVVVQSLDEIWHPQIQVLNQQKVWPTFAKVVEIAPNGDATYRQRVWGTFSQPLELQAFPLDEQSFGITLVAVGNAPDEVRLEVSERSRSGIAEELSLADWTVTGWQEEVAPYWTAPGAQPRASTRFAFEASRNFAYYAVHVVLPLIVIVTMSWVVFWIDPRQGATQVGVVMTSMLTLIAFRFAIASMLPRVPYITRMDYFILLSTLLVFATLVVVIWTAGLANRGSIERALRIDSLSRRIFPAVFSLVLLLVFIL